MMSSAVKIKNVNEAKVVRKRWREKGLKTVFTNGCFDLLHLGHVEYLEKARTLGDRLILGLNTDASIQRFKGAERPIQNQRSRSRVIASLQFVDLVVLFDESTPLDLISALVPDILVKGSDYLAENIVGADIVTKVGGQVKTINFMEGFSTTKIIERIKN